MNRFITLSLLLSLFVPLSLFAGDQGSEEGYDLGVSKIVTPEEGDTIYNFLSTGFQFSIKNYGDEQVEGPGQFSHLVDVGLNIEGGQPVIFEQIPLHNDPEPGDSTITNEQGVTTSTPSEGNFEVCAWTEEPDDPDRSNDTTCAVYFFKDYKRDIGIDAITKPAPESTIDYGQPTEFAFNLINNSDEPLDKMRNVAVLFSFKDGGSQTILEQIHHNSENEPVPANGSIEVEREFTINQGDVPSDTIQLCFTVDIGQVQEVLGNIEHCEEYYFRDVTSIESRNEFSSNISVYPNPSTGDVRFTWDEEMTGEVTLDVYDITGRKVHREVQNSLNTTDITLKEGTLDKGTYIYKLTSGNLSDSGRFILK